MSNASWWTRAQAALPGGVNSPVRAFKSVPGDPVFFKSAKGARFTDEDGKEYIDYCQSWGPMILGHADPDVQAAIEEAVREGCSFGAPSRREVLLAEAVLERVKVFERVRFVSSGTEAVMSAIRLARGVTGRDKILKFSGCYHGHADHLLVEAGSGLATFGTPSSGGVPADFSKHTAVLPLADEERLREFFDAHGDELACLIIEPVPANSGLLIQSKAYLQLCRDLTEKHGALLIFDEVISGFRVAPGGAAELYGITPDIATYGKIIGGGMPVGAYAASAEIFKHVSPDGPVYQAGTLSGNPVAMAAGLATLEKLGKPGVYEELERKTVMLAEGLRGAAREAGVTATVVQVGSLFWTVFQEHAPNAVEQVDSDMSRYGEMHAGLLERGVYLAPSGWEIGFMSTAHLDADISQTLKVVGSILAQKY